MKTAKKLPTFLGLVILFSTCAAGTSAMSMSNGDAFCNFSDTESNEEIDFQAFLATLNELVLDVKKDNIPTEPNMDSTSQPLTENLNEVIFNLGLSKVLTFVNIFPESTSIRPRLSQGSKWSEAEEDTLKKYIKTHTKTSRECMQIDWSKVKKYFPNRTVKAIECHYNSVLKRQK